RSAPMKIPAMKFKVGLVQMAMSADPDANLQTAVAKVAEAAAAGAQLVCLPELFRSRYFAQREDAASFDLAEPVPGPSTEALQGAAVLFYPTAIGWHPKEKATHGAQQLDAWRTIQRSHAIANGCYVAAVNRVGHERPRDRGNGDGIEFWGSSFLADPFGVVVAEAPRDREAIVIAEVDLGRIEEVRRGWPFLRDRRIDAYGGIGQRFLDAAPSAVSSQPSASPRRAESGRLMADSVFPGFRMPAEWEPHHATWIGWPQNASECPGKLAPIQWVYGEIARKLVPGEIVRILVNSAAHERRARGVLGKVGVDPARLEFFRFPTNRGWTRDFGPLFVVRPSPQPELAVARFRFNAWAKYLDWKRDDKVPELRSEERR